MTVVSLKFSSDPQAFVLSDGSVHVVHGGWDEIIEKDGLAKYEQDNNIKIVRNVKCLSDAEMLIEEQHPSLNGQRQTVSGA